MQKLKAHPDLGGEEWNATVINEAYHILMDSKKRIEYDAILFRKENHNTLGKQHEEQRQAEESPAANDDWKPFKPRVIKG